MCIFYGVYSSKWGVIYQAEYKTCSALGAIVDSNHLMVWLAGHWMVPWVLPVASGCCRGCCVWWRLVTRCTSYPSHFMTWTHNMQHLITKKCMSLFWKFGQIILSELSKTWAKCRYSWVSRHCVCWWSGAAAPDHQQTQCRWYQPYVYGTSITRVNMATMAIEANVMNVVQQHTRHCYIIHHSSFCWLSGKMGAKRIFQGGGHLHIFQRWGHFYVKWSCVELTVLICYKWLNDFMAFD